MYSRKQRRRNKQRMAGDRFKSGNAVQHEGRATPFNPTITSDSKNAGRSLSEGTDKKHFIPNYPK